MQAVYSFRYVTITDETFLSSYWRHTGNNKDNLIGKIKITLTGKLNNCFLYKSVCFEFCFILVVEMQNDGL